ncbi:DUF4232 domain-containing protein [Streptomyces palmae]|uniref:DUF4232 domain-containing protein n=1 Tax=Streptomyces palmae TaxID=1701085 RepID=A0A4Z0H872_9ACTN|nr:DUF4232 domain-containing protein [Streptomyces palmae]TGB06928.1 DUF4232 domain-containing protein [Streptomyces palmae]
MNAAMGRSDRALRLAAVGVTAVAVLTVISACGDGAGGVRTDGRADTSFADGRAEAVVDAQPAGRGPRPTGEATPSGIRTATCTTDQLALRVSTLTNPPSRLVLRATNTSRTTCAAEGHPEVRFGRERTAIAVDSGSGPGSAPTLAPGKSAYAAIVYAAAAGAGERPRAASALAVYPTGPGAADGTVWLPLPRQLIVDDSARVTHWRSTIAPATAAPQAG